jgi:hypothetical protein
MEAGLAARDEGAEDEGRNRGCSLSEGDVGGGGTLEGLRGVCCFCCGDEGASLELDASDGLWLGEDR